MPLIDFDQIKKVYGPGGASITSQSGTVTKRVNGTKPVKGGTQRRVQRVSLSQVVTDRVGKTNENRIQCDVNTTGSDGTACCINRDLGLVQPKPKPDTNRMENDRSDPDRLGLGHQKYRAVTRKPVHRHIRVSNTSGCVTDPIELNIMSVVDVQSKTGLVHGMSTKCVRTQPTGTRRVGRLAKPVVRRTDPIVNDSTIHAATESGDPSTTSLSAVGSGLIVTSSGSDRDKFVQKIVKQHIHGMGIQQDSELDAIRAQVLSSNHPSMTVLSNEPTQASEISDPDSPPKENDTANQETQETATTNTDTSGSESMMVIQSLHVSSQDASVWKTSKFITAKPYTNQSTLSQPLLEIVGGVPSRHLRQDRYSHTEGVVNVSDLNRAGINGVLRYMTRDDTVVSKKPKRIPCRVQHVNDGRGMMLVMVSENRQENQGDCGSPDARGHENTKKEDNEATKIKQLYAYRKLAAETSSVSILGNSVSSINDKDKSFVKKPRRSASVVVGPKEVGKSSFHRGRKPRRSQSMQPMRERPSSSTVTVVTETQEPDREEPPNSDQSELDLSEYHRYDRLLRIAQSIPDTFTQRHDPSNARDTIARIEMHVRHSQMLAAGKWPFPSDTQMVPRQGRYPVSTVHNGTMWSISSHWNRRPPPMPPHLQLQLQHQQQQQKAHVHAMQTQMMEQEHEQQRHQAALARLHQLAMDANNADAIVSKDRDGNHAKTGMETDGKIGSDMGYRGTQRACRKRCHKHGDGGMHRLTMDRDTGEEPIVELLVGMPPRGRHKKRGQRNMIQRRSIPGPRKRETNDGVQVGQNMDQVSGRGRGTRLYWPCQSDGDSCYGPCSCSDGSCADDSGSDIESYLIRFTGKRILPLVVDGMDENWRSRHVQSASSNMDEVVSKMFEEMDGSLATVDEYLLDDENANKKSEATSSTTSLSTMSSASTLVATNSSTDVSAESQIQQGRLSEKMPGVFKRNTEGKHNTKMTTNLQGTNPSNASSKIQPFNHKPCPKPSKNVSFNTNTRNRQEKQQRTFLKKGSHIPHMKIQAKSIPDKLDCDELVVEFERSDQVNRYGSTDTLFTTDS